MKIIIIDASAFSRDRTEELLNDMNVSSADIYAFDNGEEALELIDESDVDIIFTSLELDEMDGVSFTDILLHKYPDMVSKLFITLSSLDSQHFQEVKEVGAKRFINKPIDVDYFKHFISKEIDKIRLKGTDL